MIYFTELSRDLKGDQSKSEIIAFQFYMRELPESIKFPYYTKVNHIEYNGGFHTNQIIGVFPREIEWEGCFYGTYEKPDGTRYSAKERSDEVKKFMGRPIRVGFAVPKGGDDYIPGEDVVGMSKAGRGSKFGKNGVEQNDASMAGIVGVYIIEEYEPEIVNYSDVNYRIKLVPHQRQKKIKPTATETIPIKLMPENLTNAANAGRRVITGTRNRALNRAKGNLDKAGEVAEQFGPERFSTKRSWQQEQVDTRARIKNERRNQAKPLPPKTSPTKKPGKRPGGL